jgi:hypothetical protein
MLSLLATTLFFSVAASAAIIVDGKWKLRND